MRNFAMKLAKMGESVVWIWKIYFEIVAWGRMKNFDNYVIVGLVGEKCFDWFMVELCVHLLKENILKNYWKDC